jgi:ABC-type transport system involved in cytochrome c biogenesis permease subunit
MRAPAVAVTSSLPNLRTKLGLAATAGSLLILVYTGFLGLPILAVYALIPGVGSECPSLLKSAKMLALDGLGLMISLLLITVGVAALALIARRARSAPAVGVVFNTIVASLLLTASITVPWGSPIGGGLGLVALLLLSAVVPLAGAVLMLDPSLFQSSRQFAATLVSAALLFSPGAVGVTVFGLQMVGVVAFPLQSSTHDLSHCYIVPRT